MRNEMIGKNIELISDETPLGCETGDKGKILNEHEEYAGWYRIRFDSGYVQVVPEAEFKLVKE